MSLRTAGWCAKPDDLRDLVALSRGLIKDSQAATGALPAALTYPVYRYCWFRDGAFIAEGLSLHGDVEAAQAFHEWCARTVLAREDLVEQLVARLATGAAVPRDDYLPTRYTVDGADGAEDWENFQTDGYGSWLWSLRRHCARHGLDPSPYWQAVTLVVRYLSSVWSVPCYDWWEEYPDQQHVSTLGAIAAGLEAALHLGVLESGIAAQAKAALDAIQTTVMRQGVVDGHAVKWLGSRAVDGSLLACVAPFRVLRGPSARRTLAAVDRDLLFDGGIYRYLDDSFYGGGRWPVLTAFRGLALASVGLVDGAGSALSWIASTATSEGYLPEQVGPRLLQPDRESDWVTRWGPVATPLLWSHGMFLILAAELGLVA